MSLWCFAVIQRSGSIRVRINWPTFGNQPLLSNHYNSIHRETKYGFSVSRGCCRIIEISREKKKQKRKISVSENKFWKNDNNNDINVTDIITLICNFLTCEFVLVELCCQIPNWHLTNLSRLRLLLTVSRRKYTLRSFPQLQGGQQKFTHKSTYSIRDGSRGLYKKNYPVLPPCDQCVHHHDKVQPTVTKLLPWNRLEIKVSGDCILLCLIWKSTFYIS